MRPAGYLCHLGGAVDGVAFIQAVKAGIGDIPESCVWREDIGGVFLMMSNVINSHSKENTP
jgi:hypothetical protein